ncbi:MAG: hypothetical protein MK358_13210, partial [Vicinamibacterales bacterium]|nr:hypothetical protein [Vicinamibacterales bacterium]
RHLDPEAYETMRAWVDRRRRATRSTVTGLRRTLEQTLTESHIPYERIEFRIKRLYGVHQKIKRSRVSLEQV